MTAASTVILWVIYRQRNQDKVIFIDFSIQNHEKRQSMQSGVDWLIQYATWPKIFLGFKEGAIRNLLLQFPYKIFFFLLLWHVIGHGEKITPDFLTGCYDFLHVADTWGRSKLLGWLAESEWKPTGQWVEWNGKERKKGPLRLCAQNLAGSKHKQYIDWTRQ
jgi:hypothetical protein